MRLPAVSLVLSLASCGASCRDGAPAAGNADAAVRGTSPVGPAAFEPAPPRPGEGAPSASASAAASPAPTLATEEARLRVRLTGRWAFEPGRGPRAGSTGTSAAVRFRGPALRVTLKDAGPNFFEVVVDGKTVNVVTGGPGDLARDLVKDLGPGEHLAELVKRTEGRVGDVELVGFEAPGGVLLDPPPHAARRLEVLGDSISAGYGNTGTFGACLFSPRTEDGYRSWGLVAARALQAEVSVTAWSGKTIGEMTELWDQTLPLAREPAWDFAAAPHPDVVLVNLGTNDFALRDQGQGWWSKKWDALLDRIHARHPDAWVFALLGPMLTDTYPAGRQNLTKARVYLKKVVADAHARGLARVVLLEHPTQKPEDGYGCGFHPSVKTHEKMAAHVVRAVREKTGW